MRAYRRAYSILGVLVMASAASGQIVPRAIVVGPKETISGDMVKLDGSQSTGTGYCWKLAYALTDTGRVPPAELITKAFYPQDNNTAILFSAGVRKETTFTFLLAVSGTNANGGTVTDIAFFDLKITPLYPPGPDPPPNPPVPVPTPGKVSAAILLYESENTTQEMEQIILKLRADKIQHLKILDVHAKQADSDQPLKVVTDALAYLKGKPLPRLIAVDSAGCSVADSDVATLEGVQRLLTSWGIQ